MVRWDRPQLNQLVRGLPKTFVTDEDRAMVRRHLPFLVEGIINVLKEIEQSGDFSFPNDRVIDVTVTPDRLDPSEIDTVLEMYCATAVRRYGYRGPSKNTGAGSGRSRFPSWVLLSSSCLAKA